jgi:hypothetical protein
MSTVDSSAGGIVHIAIAPTPVRRRLNRVIVGRSRKTRAAVPKVRRPSGFVIWQRLCLSLPLSCGRWSVATADRPAQMRPTCWAGWVADWPSGGGWRPAILTVGRGWWCLTARRTTADILGRVVDAPTPSVPGGPPCLCGHKGRNSSWWTWLTLTRHAMGRSASENPRR